MTELETGTMTNLWDEAVTNGRQAKDGVFEEALNRQKEK